MSYDYNSAIVLQVRDTTGSVGTYGMIKGKIILVYTYKVKKHSEYAINVQIEAAMGADWSSSNIRSL